MSHLKLHGPRISPSNGHVYVIHTITRPTDGTVSLLRHRTNQFQILTPCWNTVICRNMHCDRIFPCKWCGICINPPAGGGSARKTRTVTGIDLDIANGADNGKTGVDDKQRHRRGSKCGWMKKCVVQVCLLKKRDALSRLTSHKIWTFHWLVWPTRLLQSVYELDAKETHGWWQSLPRGTISRAFDTLNRSRRAV